MNDRPDWLPEPIEPPRRPRGEQLHLAAISVASLLLFMVGAILLTATAALLLSSMKIRGAPGQVVLITALSSLSAFVVTYLLRWCLHRERQRGPK